MLNIWFSLAQEIFILQKKRTMFNLYASIVKRVTENSEEMELDGSFTILNTTDAGTKSTVSL